MMYCNPTSVLSQTDNAGAVADDIAHLSNVVTKHFKALQW